MSTVADVGTTRRAGGEGNVEHLEHSWGRNPGIIGWLSVTTHAAIGLRYIVTAFIFLLIGGLEALIMRFQLALPDNDLLSPDRYNQLLTTHAQSMMVLFAVPMMEGI